MIHRRKLITLCVLSALSLSAQSALAAYTAGGGTVGTPASVSFQPGLLDFQAGNTLTISGAPVDFSYTFTAPVSFATVDELATELNLHAPGTAQFTVSNGALVYTDTAAGAYDLTVFTAPDALTPSTYVSGTYNAGDAIAIGNNAWAEGNTNAIAIGSGARASASSAIALGYSAEASTYGAIAIGEMAVASGTVSTAIGKSATASGVGAVAMGSGASSEASSTISIGTNSSATAEYATAVGGMAKSYGTNSVSLGYSAVANDSGSMAIGANATASGANSVAIGQQSIATSANEFSVGNTDLAITRRITNVTSGIEGGRTLETATASNAATMGDLQALQTSIASNYITTATADTRYFSASAAATLAGQVAQLRTDVDAHTTAINTATTTANTAVTIANTAVTDASTHATNAANSATAAAGSASWAATSANIASNSASSAATSEANAATSAQAAADHVVTAANHALAASTSATSAASSATAAAASETNANGFVAVASSHVDAAAGYAASAATSEANAAASATSAANSATSAASSATAAAASETNAANSALAAATSATIAETHAVNSATSAASAATSATNAEASATLAATSETNSGASASSAGASAVLAANSEAAASASAASASTSASSAASSATAAAVSATEAYSYAGNAATSVVDMTNLINSHGGGSTSYEDGDPYHAASVSVSQGNVTISAGDPNTFSVTATSIEAQLEAGSVLTLRNGAGKGITLNDTGISVTANTTIDMGGNRIQGVADGVAPTDAVNVQQANAIAVTVAQPIIRALADTDARVATLESGLQSLNSKVDDVAKTASAGIAQTAAMSQPVVFAPGATTSMTAGVGSYNGEQAVAVTYNKLVVDTEARKQVFSVGAGMVNGSGKSVIRAGYSWSW